MQTCIQTNTNILSLIAALEGVPPLSIWLTVQLRKAIHLWCLLAEHKVLKPRFKSYVQLCG